METVGLNNHSSSFIGKRAPQGRLASLFFVAFVPMGCFYALREFRISQLVSGGTALTIAAISGVALYPKKESDLNIHELPPLGPDGMAKLADPAKVQALAMSYRIELLERLERAVRGGSVARSVLEEIQREIEEIRSKLPDPKEQEEWRRMGLNIAEIIGDLDALDFERRGVSLELRSANQGATGLLEQAEDLMVNPYLSQEAIHQLETQAATLQLPALQSDNMTDSIDEQGRAIIEKFRQLRLAVEMLRTDLSSRHEVVAAQVAAEQDTLYLETIKWTYHLEYKQVPDDGNCLFHAASGAMGQPTDPNSLRATIATRIRTLFAPGVPETPFRSWVEGRINDFVQETATSESRPRGCPQAYYEQIRAGQSNWESYCTSLEGDLLFGGEVEAAFLAEIFDRPIVIHHRLQTQVHLPNHEPCEGNYDAISALIAPLHLFHAGGVHYNYFTHQTSAAASSS